MPQILIDGDLIAYPIAAYSENDPVEIALQRAQDKCQYLYGVLSEQSFTRKIYLGGRENYRYEIYPEYKANRKQTRPVHLTAVRDFLVEHWKAEVVQSNIETDDVLGIEASKDPAENWIFSFDKDLLMIPCNHYNWKKDIYRVVSKEEGLRTFYKQIIAGDGADNIPSFDGKIRSAVPKFIASLQEPLEHLQTASQMYLHCLQVYIDAGSDQATLDRNAQLLYILQEEGKFWQRPE